MSGIGAGYWVVFVVMGLVAFTGLLLIMGAGKANREADRIMEEWLEQKDGADNGDNATDQGQGQDQGNMADPKS